MIHNIMKLSWRQWCFIAFSAYLCAIWSALSFLSNRNAVVPRQKHSIEQPLDRFADSINVFEEEDKLQPPQEGGTVFIGSSTFAHAAQRLQDEFKDFSPVVRAFGGSTIPEINHYIEETVLKYKPSRICFYAGTNDIADGHSGRRVYRDFVRFAELVHARLPDTEIFFVSMSMAPSRVQWRLQYAIGNKLVQTFARHNSFVHYVDVTTTMYDSAGHLRTDWFLDDDLHMNQHGYDAWFPVIRDALSSRAW